jgi:UDP-N-acetylmuramyl pentapeptide phosphotransferase/UDP-N-acetylglucosamine-1-phosphate transferase
MPTQLEETRLASLIFAAVVATLAFLAFDRTRAFGIVGVFVLLALEPVWFSVLFAGAGLAYLYYNHGRK